MKKFNAAIVLALFAFAVALVGCGDDEKSSNAQSSAKDSTGGSTWATPSAEDLEKLKAERIKKAKAAVAAGAKQNRKEEKAKERELTRSKNVPDAGTIDQSDYKVDSSGKNANSGFATFAIPKGWAERNANPNVNERPKAERLTQLVPAAEVKSVDSAGGSFTAAIAVQALPNAPSWAKKSTKGMIEYAELYDNVAENTAVKLKVDGADAVGFGLTSAKPNVTSVYTIHGGKLYQINGGRTAPNGSPSMVQDGVMTIVNSWSWK